ncbi:ABC transporter ATP-binding protein [Oscillospiraceae bacterium HV4-5-C5C]|nr:ABC transporter ATP-binding protein [Oscillospiraceae bacterium HV4-5-C5C]
MSSAKAPGTASVRPVPRPDHLSSYFKLAWRSLTLVTASGILYNAGLVAGPYFEGQLVQCLYDIISGRQTFPAMLRLAAAYLLVILTVQLLRSVKRFYVRRFANHTSRSMRQMLYNSLVNLDQAKAEQQDVGVLLTKAVADVDVCTEGMRKFTTELFDTGVVLIAYLALLFSYDWRLTLLSAGFTPLAYLGASLLRRKVTRANLAYKQSAGRLNSATLDRVGNALTYRVYGCDLNRDQAYEAALGNYEKMAARANFWENTPQPLYHCIAMTGIIWVLWLGSRNVTGQGWRNWDLAAFTTYLSAFGKMALKASSAARLFNSVQKAQVSWARIKPLMKPWIPPAPAPEAAAAAAPESGRQPLLDVRELACAWPGHKPLLQGLSFSVRPGEILGVTGAVACGKSLLGLTLLGELPYQGSVRLAGRELCQLGQVQLNQWLSYMGHDPELMSATVTENIRMGRPGAIQPALRVAALDKDVAMMQAQADTPVGLSGVRLSGGQQARLALARTCFRARPLLILDDPFAAVDAQTETVIFGQLRQLAREGHGILLLSHRLRLFPQLDQVLFLEQGQGMLSSHQALLQSCPSYARIYQEQTRQGGQVK